MDSAHEKAELEAWIQEHTGSSITETRNEVGIKLTNGSTVVFSKNTRHWNHFPHYSYYNVKDGVGFSSMILYLESLNMPKVALVK